MRNYVVVIDHRYTYNIEVQAEDEDGAESIVRRRICSDELTPSDFNESLNVIDEGEAG